MTTPADTPAAPAAPKQYSHRQILVIMSGLMLGMLLAALDQTIVSTALTTIAKDFKRPDLYSWVVTSYLLTSTASTPLYGKIGDLFGRKRIFQFAIVLFLIGSILSGLSGSMIQLILFRGVQGLGAGGLMSIALSIVGDVIPPRDRGRYQGYFGAIFGASSVLGPLIGGFLVDQASWRWVFYVNVPIGIVALVVINRVLHLDQVHRAAKIDFAGSLLLVGGVSLFLIAVQDTGTHAGLTSQATTLGVLGLLFIGAFILWERRATEPVLPLRLFGNSVFTVSSALSLITGASMFGALIFLPQYLQIVRHISPTISGLRLLPMLAGLLLTSITSGRLISKYGRYKSFVIAGTAILTAGLALLTQLTVTTNPWVFSGMLFVIGVGLGLFMQTLVLATQNSIERSDLGVGTSAITFFRTLGGAIGAAVLGAILIAKERSSLPADIAHHGPKLGPLEAFTHGMQRAYLWTIPVSILAFLLSFLLKEVRLRTAADQSLVSEATTEHARLPSTTAAAMD